MFSHFTLGSNNLTRSEHFYSALLGSVGLALVESNHESGYVMFGPTNHSFPHLFVSIPFDDLPATWSNGFHIAFNVPDTESVDRFFAAAMANGGYDEGAPGLRNQYADDYYGAYVRDPDGNKLQAVCYTNGRRCADTGNVISHITIGLANFNRERDFYKAVLSTLGIVELPEESDGEDAAFGIEGFELPIIFVQPTFNGKPATWGNGTHTAFHAPNRDAVHKFHAAALANGGTCEGPPGPRPQYSEHYYAAYVRDAVGNKIQAVYRGAE